jgi:hypothetical protein
LSSTETPTFTMGENNIIAMNSVNVTLNYIELHYFLVWINKFFFTILNK